MPRRKTQDMSVLKNKNKTIGSYSIESTLFCHNTTTRNKVVVNMKSGGKYKCMPSFLRSGNKTAVISTKNTSILSTTIRTITMEKGLLS